MLDETGVAITPGLDFDAAHGSRTVRLSFAGGAAEIEEVLRRLGPAFRRGTSR